MKNLWHRLRRHSFIRYAFVGGISYIVELSSLLLIYHFGHTSRELATAVAYWIGLLLAFALQKLIAFKDYRKEVKALTKQGLLYGCLNLWDYGFSILVVGLFPSKYLIFSRTLAQIIFSAWNYFIYKHVIFKNSSKGDVIV